MLVESRDEQGAAGLRGMKRTAAGALLLAVGLYGLSFLGDAGGWSAWGFLRAGAEAALVGGLADWFAVTALFRHPLGLPVPHTALIPRKKDELATKLGEFVTGHFVTPDAVATQISDAAIIGRVGTWLADRDNAEALAREAARAGGVVLAALDDRGLVDYAIELLRRDQARRSYAPALGRLLQRAVEGDVQRPLVDLLAGNTATWMRANMATLRPQVKRYVEERGVLAWLLISDKRIENGILDLAELLDDVAAQPRHPLRLALDELFRSYARSLREDRHAAARIDALARRLVDDPAVQAVVREVVVGGLASVRESLADSEGDLTARLADLVVDLGTRATSDAEFGARLEGWLLRLVRHVVAEYGQELTELIRKQVAAWDGQSASRRIELAVGRDLQFIRINGTVVGALAGLAIHLGTVALT